MRSWRRTRDDLFAGAAEGCFDTLHDLLYLVVWCVHGTRVDSNARVQAQACILMQFIQSHRKLVQCSQSPTLRMCLVSVPCFEGS